MASPFNYSNYRIFLKDYYQSMREEKGFSYTQFAAKAGFKSKTYIIDIVAGKKSLSNKSILSVAKAMKLKQDEVNYFEALVLFNESKNLEDREFYFKRMQKLSGKSKLNLISEAQYEYFSTWYHVVIRELVCMESFTGNLKTLARKLNPPIAEKQAEESITLLLRLGLIQKLAGNKYRQSDGQIHTGDETSSHAIQLYQKKHAELAVEAIGQVAGNKKDISTFTAGISKTCFDEIKKELALFRRHLSEIVDKDKNPDRVYQLNLQLFPLSDVRDKEEAG